MAPELKHVHIVGICGTLMGAFAALLARRGIKVTGSDENVYPPMSDVLRNTGIEIFQGYRAENLQQAGQPDLVVIGNVIRPDNPEGRAAIDGGMAYSSLPEFMEKQFLPGTRNLVVAGTHGKTTTSSLLAHVLAQAGQKPSYFIGGVSHDLPHSFHVDDQGKYFVLEGDEYDTAFWDKVPKFNHYLPNDVILTSIEFDHIDIYPDLAAVHRAFYGLVERVREPGRMIACFDYPDVKKIVEKYSGELLSYSSSDGNGAQYVPKNVATKNGLTEFDITDNGQSVAQITMNMSGTYNVLNATAVWILCTRLGLTSAEVVKGIAGFKGVKRRQEVRGVRKDVTVIDDFAHHPTAVRETLSGLKQKYRDQRLVAVFEPRSATSRRNVFQKEYGQAFQSADQIFIAPAYDQSRIPENERLSSEQLVAEIQSNGGVVELLSKQGTDAAVSQVADFARPGDIIAVLSNGGFGGFIPKLLEKLPT